MKIIKFYLKICFMHKFVKISWKKFVKIMVKNKLY